MDTNISVIQLIKQGEIDLEYEISNLRANGDINIHIRNYLKHSTDYKKITEQINNTIESLQQTTDENEIKFLTDKLENLRKVEKDFIANCLLLAKTFANMEIRTEKLRKAIYLFEQGKINEADLILNEAELFNDQANLIPYLEYLEERNKMLLNEVSRNKNFPKA